MKPLILALLLMASAPIIKRDAPTIPEPDAGIQTERWHKAVINPKDSIRLDKAVTLYTRHKDIYERIQAMRDNGVPAPILFGLHYRESDNDFTANPAQGDPLTHRSIHVPKGRIPPPVEPPFTFIQAAEDAYYTVDKLDTKDWKHLESALNAIEGFNGFGYAKKGLPSPYVWSGVSSVYQRGKYVADGKYSATAIDQQLGVAAILIRMHERGVYRFP